MPFCKSIESCTGQSWQCHQLETAQRQAPSLLRPCLSPLGSATATDFHTPSCCAAPRQILKLFDMYSLREERHWRRQMFWQRAPALSCCPPPFALQPLEETQKWMQPLLNYWVPELGPPGACCISHSSGRGRCLLSFAPRTPLFSQLLHLQALGLQYLARGRGFDPLYRHRAV